MLELWNKAIQAIHTFIALFARLPMLPELFAVRIYSRTSCVRTSFKIAESMLSLPIRLVNFPETSELPPPDMDRNQGAAARTADSFDSRAPSIPRWADDGLRWQVAFYACLQGLPAPQIHQSGMRQLLYQ